MTFKSDKQPFCRYCGKAIRKSTDIVRVKPEPSTYDRPSLGSGYYYGVLRTKADCQRVSNQQVVSVSYHDVWSATENDEYGNRKRSRGTVALFTTWDGESYEDQFFCTGDHAKRFGYAMAKMSTYSMDDFWKALKKQTEALKKENA